jgi:hypothetical protein
MSLTAKQIHDAHPTYKMNCTDTHTHKKGPPKEATTGNVTAGTTITVYGEEERTKGRIRCRAGAHPSTGKPTTTATDETSPTPPEAGHHQESTNHAHRPARHTEEEPNEKQHVCRTRRKLYRGGQPEEDPCHPNNGAPHGVMTPRWHLQQDHDAEASLPPDPWI